MLLCVEGVDDTLSLEGVEEDADCRQVAVTGSEVEGGLFEFVGDGGDVGVVLNES